MLTSIARTLQFRAQTAKIRGMHSASCVQSERWLALILVSAGLACSSSGIKARSPDGAQAADGTQAGDAASAGDAAWAPDVTKDSLASVSLDVSGLDSPVATIDAGLCGNGKLDPGEECDDGNTVDGDGCMSDCWTPTGSRRTRENSCATRTV